MSNETHMQKTIEILEERISELEIKISNLLEKNAEKIIKASDTRVMLEVLKLDFLESRPHDRTDAMNDRELVFWYSYLIKGTPSAEILNSFAELGKRVKKIKELVKHYMDYALHNNLCETGKEEEWARIRVKNFLEYMAKGVLLRDKVTGRENVPTFYQATSPWAVNSYGNKVGLWQNQRQLEDKPLE